MSLSKPKRAGRGVVAVAVALAIVVGAGSGRAFGRVQATLTGKGGPFGHVAFSPDGSTLVAVASAERSAFLPGGKVLAGSGAPVLNVWDTQTGKVKWTRMMMGLMGLESPFLLSPDGKTVALDEASVALDRAIMLRDAQTGKLKRTLRIEGMMLLSIPMAFSPDAKVFALPTADGAIQLWDAQTGNRRARLGQEKQQLQLLVFSPDGSTLASAGWRMALKPPRGGAVQTSGSDPMVVKIWDTKTGNRRAALEQPKENAGVSTSSGAKVPLPFVADVLMFSPDAKMLASLGGLTIAVWDVETGKLKRTRQPTGCDSFAFSPDAKALRLVALHGGKLHLATWDLDTGQIEDLTQSSSRTQVCSAAFSPSGRLAASADTNNLVRLWDAETGEEIAALKRRRRGPASYAPLTQGAPTLTFSPDGKTLAAVSRDGAIDLWDLTEFASGMQSASETVSQPPSQPEPESRRKPRPQQKKELRVWTSADGRFTVEAEFVKAIQGTVYLKREDGKEIIVPLEKLSEIDQEFIRTK